MAASGEPVGRKPWRRTGTAAGVTVRRNLSGASIIRSIRAVARMVDLRVERRLDPKRRGDTPTAVLEATGSEHRGARCDADDRARNQGQRTRKPNMLR
jgi:hypothetical protein